MSGTKPTPDDDRFVATSRHVSMRIPLELYERLEGLATDGHESVSQCARRLLADGLEAPDRDAIDDAISALLLVRRQLAEQDRATRYAAPIESRVVNILNAKTDLQHLIDDVERGVEIIITHAGAQRARLVAVAARHDSPTSHSE
jgi:hypothetical protein